MRRACAVWVLGVCPAPAVLVAQAPWTASARMAILDYRVNAGFGTERFNGWALGLEVSHQFGSRLVVRLAGQGAQLRSVDAVDLDRRMGEIEAGAQVLAAAWWGLYSSLTVRAVASDVARQRWLFGRIGAEMHPAFVGANLRALGRLGVIPATHVSGLPTGSVALDGAVGLEYENGGVAFALVYGLERFDFPAENGFRRAEQVSALTLRGGIRWPRQLHR